MVFRDFVVFRDLLCAAADPPWRSTWCHCAAIPRNLNFRARAKPPAGNQQHAKAVMLRNRRTGRR
jgi:hypothetical protein